YNGTAATIPAGNTQTLTLGGTAGGTLGLSYNGVSATSVFSPTNEVQTLTIGGADTSTFSLSYGSTQGTDATKLTVTPGVSPTADQVKAHLNSIQDLNGNVQVMGDPGGPFTITFQGALSGIDASELSSNDPANVVTTQTNGSAYSAISNAQLKA